jgi:hypothetical protein
MTPFFVDGGTTEVGGWYYHGNLHAGLLQQIDMSILIVLANDNKQYNYCCE